MKFLREVPPGGEGLVVLRCDHWGYNSIGVVSEDEACVVDPGLTPGEVAAMGDALREGGRRVTTVLLTHSHHDHIRGWDAFPGARVVAPAAVRDKGEGPRARILAGKARFDERLEDPAPGFRYPEVDDAFEVETTFRVGRLEVEARFLPGHSNCTSVALVPALGALLTADYLVVPGLPYCRWEAAPFERAQRELSDIVRARDVDVVVPAHNDLIEGRDAIEAAIRAELDYFAELRRVVGAHLADGAGKDELLRRCAAHMGERRGEDLGPRARQDAENARRVLAELS